jgi:hypothetical protein
MPRKRHTAEEIVTKLRQVDVLISQGRAIAEAVRTIGVMSWPRLSEQIFRIDRWSVCRG